LRAENAIDAPYETQAILSATEWCLFDDAFRDRARNVTNPYGSGNVGEKIMNVLATVDLGPALLRKKMVTRGESRGGWFR
jgi:UDP-N-acetylglucosamine 2-epimerase